MGEKPTPQVEAMEKTKKRNKRPGQLLSAEETDALMKFDVDLGALEEFKAMRGVWADLQSMAQRCNELDEQDPKRAEAGHVLVVVTKQMQEATERLQALFSR